MRVGLRWSPSAPLVLEGALGVRRQGTVLALHVDDPEALRAAMLARRPDLGAA